MAKNDRNVDVFSTLLKKNTQLTGDGYTESSKTNKKSNEIEITILPELKSYIPPLLADEIRQLEQNILEQGCREALIVWKKGNEFILVDGHNRHSICQKYGIDYQVEIKEFSDIEAVKDFMINNQLGKRNVTEEVKSYLRGLQYKNEKQRQGGSGSNQFSKVESLTTFQKTSEKLAQEHRVSEKTIRNDEKFVKNLETFVGNDSDLKWKILNKQALISKSDLEKVVKLTELQIIELRKQLKETGKLDLPKSTNFVVDKEKKITQLFNLFLKTHKASLIDEIYEMMKEMAK